MTIITIHEVIPMMAETKGEVKETPARSAGEQQSQGAHGAPAGAHGHKPSPIAGFLSQVRKHPLFFDGIFILVVLAAIGGIWLWQDMSGKIYIENAHISAPLISISPLAPGPIEKFYVSEGDEVSEGQKLALVGNEVVTAKTQGIIVWIDNAPGQLASAGTPIVQMVDPREMRVIGDIEEDKGLKDVKPGQQVIFTVDAFGAKQYNGTVDSIGMTSEASDIVFSISDKRQENNFQVRALFDTKEYPELKNGMSAKMWVLKGQ